MLHTVAFITLLVAGCSFGPGNLQSRHSSDLESRRIRRIAVVPPSLLSGDSGAKSATAPARAERDPGELLARIAYSVAAPMPKVMKEPASSSLPERAIFSVSLRLLSWMGPS